MMDVKQYVDPKAQDTLLTDISIEDLKKMYSDRGKKYLQESSTSTVVKSEDFPVQGFMYGDNYRSMIFLPTKIKNKTVEILYLIDTGSPYTYISQKTFDHLGYTFPTSEGQFLINSRLTLIHISPPNSHFEDINILGTNYTSKNELEVACDYKSRCVTLSVSSWNPS